MMHLLPCPTCGAQIPVSPSQAGDYSTCPGCKTSVAIPNLGELRKLPPADPTADDRQDSATLQTSAARSIGFGLLIFLAAGCLLVGGYCGIRWFLTDVPLTTERHIEELRTGLKSVEPAQLIREYEDMEKFGLDLPEPYTYQIAENSRLAWGRNAAVAASIGIVSVLIALMLAATGRKKRPA